MAFIETEGTTPTINQEDIETDTDDDLGQTDLQERINEREAKKAEAAQKKREAKKAKEAQKKREAEEAAAQKKAKRQKKKLKLLNLRY